MCDMDPTIKLNTSSFFPTGNNLQALLAAGRSDFLLSSRPWLLPIFQPIFSFQVVSLTRDLLALLEQLLWLP